MRPLLCVHGGSATDLHQDNRKQCKDKPPGKSRHDTPQSPVGSILRDCSLWMQGCFGRVQAVFRPHTGKLSCLRAGISTFLPLSIASARAMRFLVECGMITSSM